MAAIGTRLAGDLALGKSFDSQNDFDQWERELMSRRNKNTQKYQALMDSATTAAQRIKEAASAYKSDQRLYAVFLEGLQYGYHDNGDWDCHATPSASSSTESVLGHLRLSGNNENVVAWKKSIVDADAKQAAKSGYNAGSNLRKNVDSVASLKPELVDYFTIFSLEYQHAHVKENTIGDILRDISEAKTRATLDSSTDSDSELARKTARELILFFRTHAYSKYQSFLRGFNHGYTNPAKSTPSKRQPGASFGSTASKRARQIESLYSDVESSEKTRFTGPSHKTAMSAGRRLGTQFRQEIREDGLDEVLSLLSQYYDEEMKLFERRQKHPILIKRGSLLTSLFTDNVDLTAPITEEEFRRVFGSVENTIDTSNYVRTFVPPLVRKNHNDRIDIVKQIFASDYGVHSFRQNGRLVEDVTVKILNGAQGVNVFKEIDLTAEEIDVISSRMLPRSMSVFDNEYRSMPAQRELDAVRACEFYAQASILMQNTATRDIETLLLTPLLVNTMTDYVENTATLDNILGVYKSRGAIDENVAKFLELYVQEKNRQWLATRIRISKGVLFSEDFLGLVTDHSAADAAFYLNIQDLSTRQGFNRNVIMKYGSRTVAASDTSIENQTYVDVAVHFGVDNYLKTSTQSLFQWLRLNNTRDWPEDICVMRRVLHDVITLNYLQTEMKERANMLDSVLSFTRTGSFTRWDLVHFLAHREKKEMTAQETVDFAQLVQQTIASFASADVPVQDDNFDADDDFDKDVYDPITNLEVVKVSAAPSIEEDFSFDVAISEEDLKRFSAAVKDMGFDTASTSSGDSYSSLLNAPSLTDWNSQYELANTLASSSSDSPVGIGARMSTGARTSCAVVARQQGVVIRSLPVMRTPKKDKDDTDYIGAFYEHAFGEKIGCAVYSRKCKKILSMEATDTDQVNVSSLLKDYIGETYPGADTSVKESIGAAVSFGPLAAVKKLFDLIIDVTVNYRPFLAGSGRERAHGIFFYPSYSYAPSEPVFISASDAMQGKRVTLSYKVNRDAIPGHAMFNADSYAWYTDESDEVGINQSGFAACRLADLTQSKGAKFTLIVPNSDEKRPKGELMLTVHSVSLPVHSEASVSSSKELSAERQHIQQKIKKYIAENKKFYKQYPNSVASVQNITVFEYACRDGIIPGSMFDSFKLAPSDEKYYVQTLAFAIRRRRPDIDIEEFNVDRWIEFDEDAKVCIFMDVLRLYVNYCSYIRDIADDNVDGSPWSRANVELIESFDYIRQRDAGDCEDFTREIIQTAMEIKYNLKSSASIAIQEMRRIAEMFVFASILCGVSREAMSLAELSKGNASLHGHECAVAIPNYIFFEALRRHDPDNQILSLHTEEEKTAGVEHKIFILEGTGCLFPEPRDKTPRFSSIQHDFNRECKDVAKHVSDMVFYNPQRNNTFYKQMISILTPEFFLRTGLTSLEFLVCRKTPAGTFRGVPFSLLLDIYANKDVEIIPAPIIPIDVFHAASRMDDDNFPPISLHRGAITSQMRDVCATLTTRLPCQGQDFFQFQIRFSQLTPARQLKIKQFAAAKKLDVLCVAEPVKMSVSTGDCVGGYTIFIF